MAATTYRKIHMISGTNDAVACGGRGADRTIDLALVTCAACAARIEKMSSTEAHLCALETRQRAQMGRFVSVQTTAAAVERAWFALAAEKAAEDVRRAEEVLESAKAMAAKLAAEVTP